MAYELHIKREKPISLKEWKKCVKKIKDLRINEEPLIAVNPKSGVSMQFAVGEGATELYDEGKSSWHHVFRYYEGSISFNATDAWKNPKSSLSVVTLKLVLELEASVFGDQGEEYKHPLLEKLKKQKKKWWQLWK